MYEFLKIKYRIYKFFAKKQKIFPFCIDKIILYVRIKTEKINQHV